MAIPPQFLKKAAEKRSMPDKFGHESKKHESMKGDKAEDKMDMMKLMISRKLAKRGRK